MPPRAPSADNAITHPAQIAATLRAFLDQHQEAALLEEGKVLFQSSDAKIHVSDEHERCTLHALSGDRSLVRTVASLTERNGRLRLATLRFGHTQTKLLELVAKLERKGASEKGTARTRYVALLERVLAREFHEWKPDGFRTSMDLERSFGPGYARGWQVRGSQAWAVIGVSRHESAAILDGILTVGLLWLEYCREHAAGKRIFAGLRIVMPRGTSMLTRTRMAWLNENAAQWELWELDEASEQLEEIDPSDTGNIAMKLVHRPNETHARERFQQAIERVAAVVPEEEWMRVQQHLRSSTELAFLLHGLEFARARVRLATPGFAHRVEISFGVGTEETLLDDRNEAQITELVADLFARRKSVSQRADFSQQRAMTARIAPRTNAAHSRTQPSLRRRLPMNSTQDPLYRASPERWLESALQSDIAPLTRGLAPSPAAITQRKPAFDANAEDNFGNRFTPPPRELQWQMRAERNADRRIIPHLDPRFVYAQVPAIAGAGDRGMIDLLGVTADGRLAIIELKTSEDMHFALQGLDYWIRVRAQHRVAGDPQSGMGEFQRHGYFADAELSAADPRLYLVAPALHIHPATETVLRYLSPAVEWQLLAVDERWREQVRVVWRRSSAQRAASMR
ncbi:hypothetical protein ACFQBQ_07380 [Granulicella cerasi]|uniref:Uncharacterized protein n=1 Tax=Granulicella cerasi TaxID=741063 RepID=A0ABW1Z8L2_9BACT|nr:hypothetical protein [Granulicella cerasi]